MIIKNFLWIQKETVEYMIKVWISFIWFFIALNIDIILFYREKLKNYLFNLIKKI
jgi:hypothetical protein